MQQKEAPTREEVIDFVNKNKRPVEPVTAADEQLPSMHCEVL
jgi:hypothetical protein